MQNTAVPLPTGKESPFRNRSVEENLTCFFVKNGEFNDGEKVLELKSMASPNMNIRDPVIYRIVKTSHHRTGDDWHIPHVRFRASTGRRYREYHILFAAWNLNPRPCMTGFLKCLTLKPTTSLSLPALIPCGYE